MCVVRIVEVLFRQLRTYVFQPPSHRCWQKSPHPLPTTKMHVIDKLNRNTYIRKSAPHIKRWCSIESSVLTMLETERGPKACIKRSKLTTVGCSTKKAKLVDYSSVAWMEQGKSQERWVKSWLHNFNIQPISMFFQSQTAPHFLKYFTSLEGYGWGIS